MAEELMAASLLGGNTEQPTNPATQTFMNNVSTAQQNAPQLKPSHALAVGSAGGDVTQNGQALAAGQHHTDVAQAHDVANTQSGGILGDLINIYHKVEHPVMRDVIKPAESALGEAGKILNVPLSFGQHEYRYFHDVEARYGIGSAITEGLVVAAGAAVGAAATLGSGGNVGAGIGAGMLAANFTAGVEGLLSHHDSWVRTADGNTYRDPHTHDVVSLGRDISHALGLTGPTFTTWSGTIDLLGDLALDPTGSAGKVYAGARSVEGLGGIFKSTFVGKSWNPDNLDQLYNSVFYPGFKRAVDKIAGMDNPAEILNYAPDWKGLAPMVNALAAAKTPEEVLTAMKEAVKAGELARMDTVPSLSFVTPALKAARDAAASYDASRDLWLPGRMFAANMARRFTNVPGATYDPVAQKWTGNIIDFQNGPSGAVDLYRMIRYSQDHRTALYTVGQYVNADPQARVHIFNNAIMDTVAKMSIEEFENSTTRKLMGLFRDGAPRVNMSPAEYWADKMGVLRDQETRDRIYGQLDQWMAGADPGIGGTYGQMLDGEPSMPLLERDANGQIIKKRDAAVWDYQTGKGTIPDFKEVRRMAADLAGVRDISGKIDDFAYAKLTQGFLKPIMLLSMAYAEHIALAEAIPNALRVGIFGMARGAYHSAMSALGYQVINPRFENKEIAAAVGYMHRALGGNWNDSWRAKISAQAMLMTEGHLTTEALSSGHNFAKEINAPTRLDHWFRTFFSRKPMRFKRSQKDFGLLGPSALGKETFVQDWQKPLRGQAKDPHGQLAAQELLKSMKATRDGAPPFPQVDVPEPKDATFGYHATTVPWRDGRLDPHYTGAAGGLNRFGPGVYLTKDKNFAQNWMNEATRTSADLDSWGAAADMGETFVPPGRQAHVYGLNWTADHYPNFLDLDAVPPDEVRTYLGEWVKENIADQLGKRGPSNVVEQYQLTEPLYAALNDPEAELGQIYERIDATLRAMTREDQSTRQLPELMDLAQQLHRRYGYNGFRFQAGKHLIGAPEHEAVVVWPIAGDTDRETLRELQGRAMQTKETLDRHTGVMDELRNESEQYRAMIPNNLDEHEFLGRVAQHKIAAGHFTHRPELEDVLKQHGVATDAGEGIRRLDEETIPELQMKNAEAEARLREARGTPEYPIEVTAHKQAAWSDRALGQNWEMNHGHVAAVNQASKVVADAMRKRAEEDPEWAKNMQRANARSDPNPSKGTDQFDDWARLQVHDVAAHANWHPAILDKIAKGQTPSKGLLHSIPTDQWPEKVLARRGTMTVSGSLFQRATDAGFRFAINPFVMLTTRGPLFHTELHTQMRALQPLIDKGYVTEDEAMTHAMSVASIKMTKHIHNLHDRTQMGVTLRNLAPFYFAQEQAYRRTMRLWATDPGAAWRYMMLIVGVHRIAASAADPNKNGYYTFPGGSWLARETLSGFKAFGLPLGSVDTSGFETSLNSANVIFPLAGEGASAYRPEFSPLAILPAKALARVFQNDGEVQSALNDAFGNIAMSAGLRNEIIPNSTVNRAIDMIQGASGFGGRDFASSMMYAMQLAAYQQGQAMERWVREGQKGPPPEIIPTEQQWVNDPHAAQDFINRIKNQTTILFGMKAILGLLLPTSFQPKIEDFGLPEELRRDITKFGISKGFQKFLLRHPDATPWTVYQSATTEGGTIPESQQGMDWINANQGFVAKYHSVAAYMMPNVSNVFSQAAYDEQLAQGLRHKRDPLAATGPTSYMTQLYVAAGNHVYYPAVAQHEANLTAAGSDKTAVNVEYADWNQYMAQLQTQMPVWAAYGPLSNFKSSQMRQQIEQLRTMIVNHEVPNNPNAKALAALTHQFDIADANYAAAAETLHYSKNETLVNDQWKAYLDGLKKQYPQLSAAISAIFYEALGHAGQIAVPVGGP